MLQIGDKPLQPTLLQEQKSLTKEEIRILRSIRNRKFFFIISSYITFLCVLYLGWIWEWDRSIRRGEEYLQRYKLVAPIFMSFLFIVLTIYFVRFYLKSLHPFIKDLKKGVKELTYFQPESYKTPFFDNYYIRTISEKNTLVRINKEMYDAIQPGSKACMAVSPLARFVFYIDVEGTRIEFNEKNSILER